MDWNELLNTPPETVISKNSQVTGDIQFNFLLRIDGNATGRIIAPLDANLVISRSGTYRGDIRGLGSVFIDGKIHGNIYALRLFLGPHAAVRGDIHCQRFSCSGTASVVGRLHINPNAPINTSFACTHLVKEDMLLTPLKPSKQPFSNQNDDSVTNDRPDGLFALDQLHEEGRVYQLDDMSQTPRAHTPSELQAQSPKPPQPEETQASGTVEVDQGNGGAEGAGDGEAQGDEEHSSSSADEVTTVPNEPADDKMEKQSDSNVSHGTTEQMDLHVTDAPEQEAELGAEDEPPHEAELGVEETQAGNIVEGAAEIDSPPPITSPEPKEEVTGNIGEATEGNAGQTEEKTSSPTTDQTDSDVHAEKQPDDMETSEEVQDNADVSKVEEEVQSKEPNSQPTDEASTLQTNDAANNPSDLADSSPQDTDPTSESSVAPTDTTTESAQDAPDAPTASDQPKVNETDDATAPPVADRRHNWLLIVEPQMDFYTGGQWCCASSASSALFCVQNFLMQNMEEIHRIVVFLDMHYGLEVEDSAYWRNAQDQSPAVGTIITLQDIEQGLWSIADPETNQELQIAHIKSLLEPHKLEEVEGQVPEQFKSVSVQKGIVIRPPHCQVGGTGAAVHTALQSLLSQWVNAHHHDVHYIMTRHPKDSSDSQSLHHIYDTSFAAQILPTDQLFVCGQMKSHCQAYGMKDMLLQIMTLAQQEGESHGDMGRRIRVLRDGTAEVTSVANIEHSYRFDSKAHTQESWRELEALGVHIVDSTTLQL